MNGLDQNLVAGIGVWIAFLIVACAGSAMRTVGNFAREYQSEYFAIETERVERLNFWGNILSALGLAGFVATAVLQLLLIPLEGWGVAIGAGASALIANYFQKITADAARARYVQLARRLLGDGAAIIPPDETDSKAATESQSESVDQVVDAVEKAGLIEMDEHQMITGIIHLDRTLVRDIMVPRMDVVTMEANATIHDALDVLIKHAVSRVPVYEESIDHIVGVLYAKDLFQVLRDAKTDAPIRPLLRPAQFVPESKRLDELLQELQKTKVHLAIVVDEYGGTAGIVTIEDILEEIVGEIQDEYDTSEEPLIERVNDTEAIFNARATIVQVNETLSLNLPDESDTLGGLVLLRLEKMPRVGDQVRVDDVTLAVTSMSGRRIKKVRVKQNESPSVRQTSKGRATR